MKHCNLVQKVGTLILITKCRHIRMKQTSLREVYYNETYQHCGALKYDILVGICWKFMVSMLTFCIIYFLFQSRISLWILWISWSISCSNMCSFIVDYFNGFQCNFARVVGATISQGKLSYNKIIQPDTREPLNSSSILNIQI